MSENHNEKHILSPEPKIEPVKIPSKKSYFPRYAVFGNLYDKWQVCILKGHGRVEIIKEFTVDQILKENIDRNKRKGKNKSLSDSTAYIMAQEKAVEFKRKMMKEKPL